MTWKDKAKVVTKAERLAREAEEAEDKLRNDEIEVAKETAGLKSVSIVQANSWVDAQLNGASTVEELKLATRKVLKKMIPYMLK